MDLDHTKRDVDGVPVNGPPSQAVVDGRGLPANGVPPPTLPRVEGGSGQMVAPPTQPQPEEALPGQVEETYAARGQANTGGTYSSHMRKFLYWLRSRGLTFKTMPAGTADTFLNETIQNPITRNVGATALRTMFETARAAGIQHVEQQITRVPTKRKRAPEGVSPMSTMAGLPMPGAYPIPPPAMAPPTASAVTVVQSDVPPQQYPPSMVQKAAPQHQQGAFPSLGQRVQVYKLAGPSDGVGIPPGTPIPIGVYQKSIIEMDGSLENFLMFRIRPYHGPGPGQPPAVYRVTNLDTSGKAMPGQAWDIPLAADVGGTQGHQQNQGQQGQYPQQQQHQGLPFQIMQPGQQYPQIQQMQQPQSAPQVMERLVDMALKGQETAQAKYERLIEQLQEKNRKGELDGSTMMLLMERHKPPQLDVDALMARARQELAQLAPPSQPVAPVQSQLAGLLDSPPRQDATTEALLGMVRDLTSQVANLHAKTSMPIPQKDPLEAFAQMMALMKSAERADPVKDALIQMTLQQFSQPQKPKGIADLIAEVKGLKEVQQLLGGGGGEPSFAENLVEIVGTLADNADKIGEMFSKMKSGAISSAFQQQRQQQPQKQLPAQQQQSQRAPVPVQTAFMEVVKAVDTNLDDEQVFQALYSTLGALHTAGGTWAKVSERVVEHFKAAQSRVELVTITTKLFQWLGALRFLATPKYVEALTDVMHRNYSLIYGLLANGEKKVLTDAPPPKSADVVPQQPMVEATEAEAETATEEEEGEAEEEAGEDPTPAQSKVG